jgi:hypothetical protein
MSQTTNEYGQVGGEEASLRDGHAVHIAGVAGSSPASPTPFSKHKQIDSEKCPSKSTRPDGSWEPPARFGWHRKQPVIAENLDGTGTRRLRIKIANNADMMRLNRELRGSLQNYHHVAKVDAAVRKILKNGFRAAQSRCCARKTPINISLEFLLMMYDRQEGRCAVTGIPFDVGPTNGGKTGLDRKPLRPSIDRIDPRQGYVDGNVRLVCAAVNYAMGPWGEGLFRLIAAHARYSR